MPAGTTPTHLRTDCSADLKASAAYLLLQALLASAAYPLLQALRASVHLAACLAEACSPAAPSTYCTELLRYPTTQEEAAQKRSSTSAAD